MADDWTAGPTRKSTIMVGGRFVSVVVVPYTTTWGDEGEVEVPTAQFTADKAREMIDAEVTELRQLRA